MNLLDLSGLHCPDVVLRLADCIRTLGPSHRLTVISTDPLSTIDIPFFLERAGHTLISQTRRDGQVVFVMECAAGAPCEDRD